VAGSAFSAALWVREKRCFGGLNAVGPQVRVEGGGGETNPLPEGEGGARRVAVGG
jgi:hypothetical protein